MSQRLSLVFAAAALVVAVLGSAPVAGAIEQLVLPRNTVGTTQLKHDAVTSIKVKNGSLLSADFKPGQIPAGPTGPAGPKGDKGDKGDAAATHVVFRRTQVHMPFSGVFVQVAECRIAERLIAGGAAIVGPDDWAAPSSPASLIGSYPAAGGTDAVDNGESPNRWVGAARTTAPTDARLVVHAVCAAP